MASRMNKRTICVLSGMPLLMAMAGVESANTQPDTSSRAMGIRYLNLQHTWNSAFGVQESACPRAGLIRRHGC